MKRWIWDVADPSHPFVVSVRARVTKAINNSNNPFGFAFLVLTSAELYGIGLTRDHIADVSGRRVPFDNTQFHDYVLRVAPGVGYELFVDSSGTASLQGPPQPSSSDGPSADRYRSSYIYLSDSTDGSEAIADVTAFSFSQAEPDVVRALGVDNKRRRLPNVISLGPRVPVPRSRQSIH